MLTTGLVIGLGELVITYGNGNILGDTTVTNWLAAPVIAIVVAGHSRGWWR